MNLHHPQHRPPLVIQFPEPGKLARKVVKRSNARKTNKYPSWKMNRMLQCESCNERNAMLLLDVCPWVRSLQPQPCTINYLLDDQQCLHFPDVLVITPKAKVLVEIKTRKHAQYPDIEERTRTLTELLPNYGYHYQLLLAEDMARNPRLQNAKLIKELGWKTIPTPQRERIRTLFMQYETLPWGALQSDSSNPHLINHICRMVLEGQLSIDFNQPLTENTPVRWVFNPIQEGVTSWESLISTKAQ